MARKRQDPKSSTSRSGAPAGGAAADPGAKTLAQKLLDGVERFGNMAPHPAVLFLGLIALVVALSVVLHQLDISVTQDVLVPVESTRPAGAEFDQAEYETDLDELELAAGKDQYRIETRTVTARSLLAADGIRFIVTSVVPNFINFGPVGIILVAMIGVGLAERSDLIRALIRMIVLVAPRPAMTAIVVALGVISSVASDAGYLVLIPLGAAAFHSLGRHPLAGLAAAFSGVAAAFGVNFFVKPIDGILVEMTNDAIHVVDPTRSIDMTSNFYFGIGSSLVLIAVCTLVTEWLVEPRLGKYQGMPPAVPAAGCRRPSRADCGSRSWPAWACWPCCSGWLCPPARRCAILRPAH